MTTKKYLLISMLTFLSLTFHPSPSLATAPDGDVAPLGARDGTVNVGDALVALRFALGLETPSQDDTVHGDVAPLDASNQPTPDGAITVGDALVILRKALGLVDWTISKDTHTITAVGGSIELSNGATLNIPPNSTTTPVEVLFAEIPTPAHIGGEVPQAYAFATDSELLTSNFTLPVEANDVTSADELMIVYMQGQHGPADPIDFTYDPSANTVSFSLPNNWTFQNIPGPAKMNLIHRNRDATTPQETNKDNTLLMIKNTPYPSITGQQVGPIPMPFFEQCNAGTCWANCGKMLQKGLFPGYLGAGFTYEVFQFMKMLNIGLDEGIVWTQIDDFADFLGRGKTIHYDRYFHWNSWSSVQKKIVEEINRENPVLFFRSEHMVLVLGYEKDIAGDLYLIQHNPKGVGAEEGFYESEKWEDAIKNHPWKDAAALLWAAETPDPNRALQSINLPGQDEPDTLYFEGKKNEIGDPHIRLHLTFDNIFEDGYRWQRFPSTTIGNSNHFPKNVNQLFFDMPIYNADLQNSATVTFGIKVYEKDEQSNAAVFSKDIVIAAKNRSMVIGSSELTPLDLTPVRVNLEEESECVLHITLERGTERTTSIPIDNFFLQPLELEITLSIPGETTDASGNYKIAADGATYTIKAEVKELDGNAVPDGTEVKFATTGGNLSTTTATTTNGEAMVTLTSPATIGSAEITASISKISGTAKVDFIAGPVSTLTLSANPTTLPADATSTSTIQIKASDANGNPVTDASIGITAASGILSAASATTDKNGVATVVYTAPTTVPQGGTDTVKATSTNAITTTGSITIEESLSWTGWPDAQWCPNTTGSPPYDTIYNPGGDPDEIECRYCGDISSPYLCTETPHKDGKKNGIEKHWDQNGQLFAETPWVDDKKHGIEKFYDENGQLEEEVSYANDIQNGIQRFYYESGQVAYEITYKDGKRNGTEKEYDENGRLEHETPWVDDEKHGTEKWYDESGRLKRERPYVDGEINGIEKFYYENGQLRSETPWIDDERYGTEKWYDESGQLTEEVVYVNNKKNGIQKWYDENGLLEHERPWKDDKKDGTEKWYYSNGQLWRETTWVDDKKHGDEKSYSTTGELTDCSTYENDTLVGSCMP